MGRITKRDFKIKTKRSKKRKGGVKRSNTSVRSLDKLPSNEKSKPLTLNLGEAEYIRAEMIREDYNDDFLDDKHNNNNKNIQENKRRKLYNSPLSGDKYNKIFVDQTEGTHQKVSERQDDEDTYNNASKAGLTTSPDKRKKDNILPEKISNYKGSLFKEGGKKQKSKRKSKKRKQNGGVNGKRKRPTTEKSSTEESSSKKPTGTLRIDLNKTNKVAAAERGANNDNKFWETKDAQNMTERAKNIKSGRYLPPFSREQYDIKIEDQRPRTPENVLKIWNNEDNYNTAVTDSPEKLPPNISPTDVTVPMEFGGKKQKSNIKSKRKTNKRKTKRKTQKKKIKRTRRRIVGE